jgi:hypothetical protein
MDVIGRRPPERGRMEQRFSVAERLSYEARSKISVMDMLPVELRLHQIAGAVVNFGRLITRFGV